MLRLADYQLRARTGARVSLKSSRCLPYPARVVRSREDPGDGSAGTDGHRRAIGHLPLALREIDRSIRQFAQRRCEVRPPRLNANYTLRIDGRIEHQQRARLRRRLAQRCNGRHAIRTGQGWKIGGERHIAPLLPQTRCGNVARWISAADPRLPAAIQAELAHWQRSNPSTARNAASNSLPLRRKNCQSSGPLANAPIKPAVPVAAAGIGGRGGGRNQRARRRAFPPWTWTETAGALPFPAGLIGRAVSSMPRAMHTIARWRPYSSALLARYRPQTG